MNSFMSIDYNSVKTADSCETIPHKPSPSANFLRVNAPGTEIAAWLAFPRAASIPKNPPPWFWITSLTAASIEP